MLVGSPRANIDGIDSSYIDESDDGGDDDTVTLPWYLNPLNMIALVLAVLVLAGTAGFVIGENHATPDASSSDIGFLQDMRAHHEQAVEMGMIMIGKPETDAVLRQIAKEITFGQGIDIGRMIQLLRDYGKPEANESGTAMAWMNEPVPLERMPGLATDSDMNDLVRAIGTDADRLFIELMIAHHEGGLHMGEYAVAHAGTDEVQDVATLIVSGQKDEIGELLRIKARLGL